MSRPDPDSVDLYISPFDTFTQLVAAWLVFGEPAWPQGYGPFFREDEEEGWTEESGCEWLTWHGYPCVYEWYVWTLNGEPDIVAHM